MIDTMTTAPVKGASKEQDEAGWFEQRRTGVTATQVRDLAGSYSTRERRRILLEKLTGASTVITGNQYIDHGNAREPLIADWIADSFDILPNDHTWLQGRYIATPDGISADEDGVVSEIKTSKHDLDPGCGTGGTLDPGVAENVRNGRSTWSGGHFWKTGYYDQVQWQMRVMNAQRTLFVWEQHDDQWPDPSPLYSEPRWCWIERDDARIAELQEVADRFLMELDAARADGLAPIGDIPQEDAQLAHDLLQYRTDEAVAKAQKEKAWKALQDRYLSRGELSLENDEARITVSLTGGGTTQVFDKEGFEAKHAAVIERKRKADEAYEKARAKFVTEVVTPPTPKLTVTAVKKSTK